MLKKTVFSCRAENASMGAKIEASREVMGKNMSEDDLWTIGHILIKPFRQITGTSFLLLLME